MGQRFALFARRRRGWDKNSDWSTQIFYTGKDRVVKVLKLSVIPLQPNQVKTFQPES